MAVFVGCRDTRTVSDGRQTKKHCIAMLFRLTAVTDGGLVGYRDTRAVTDGRQCRPSKVMPDVDGRH